MSLHEADVLASCKSYLNLLEIQGKLAWKRIHVGGIFRNGRVIKNVDMRGMADLLVFLPGEKCVHLECKSDRGKLERDQADWQARLKKVGQRYEVIRGLPDLVGVLKDYGVEWSGSMGRGC